MSPIVEMKNLNKFYGNHHVLKDIDLSVARGEVVVVIGASGSGKSTLIRCVNGLEMYQNGSLLVDGYHVPVEEDRLLGGERELAAIRKGVGMVFQQFNLFPHKTVVENITIAPMRVHKKPKAEAEATALKLLDRIGRHCLTLMQTHRIDAIHYSVLEIQLAALAKVQGGCERIALTPVPFAYSLLLHRTALVFCITLPFALAGSLDWWTLLPVLLVAYTFFGLEALGHQLEEPFGLEPNALPLAAMLRTVERDMLFLLGDTDLPEPVLARNNVLS